MAAEKIIKSTYQLIVAAPREQPIFVSYLYQIDLARRIEAHRQGVYGRAEVKGCLRFDWECARTQRAFDGTIVGIEQVDWQAIDPPASDAVAA